MSQRREVVVTGAGVVSPLADSPREFFAALCRGESALAPVDGFSVSELLAAAQGAGDGEAGNGASGTALSIPDLAGEVRGFDPKEYLGKRNFRPLDRTGRFATVAADLALAAAGWDADRRRAVEVGLVLGTMFGSVHTISAFDRRALTAGPNYAKPMDFANSVINAAAGQTAIWHDLRGINTTLSGGTTAGLQALGYAADLVAGGRAEAVLAGGADELCLESFWGFSRAGWLAGTGDGGAETPPRPIPLDVRRNGFVPGEGAGLLMLESAEAARSRGARVVAQVLGYGSTFDPSRGADAASAEAAVSRAVALALEEAGLTAGDIDCLSLSANGAVSGDAREVRGLAAVFGDRFAEIPATAVKGQVGESLGASGAYQALVALGVWAVDTPGGASLPGVPGLERMDENLPLPSLCRETRSVTAKTCLATALDFDGGAVALVLAAPNAEHGTGQGRLDDRLRQP